jgi:hypothetical protein
MSLGQRSLFFRVGTNELASALGLAVFPALVNTQFVRRAEREPLKGF